MTSDRDKQKEQTPQHSKTASLRPSQKKKPGKRNKKKKWVEPDPTGGIPDAWLPPSYWN